MKYQRLKKILSRDGSMLIFTHNNPDPDCIASALLLTAIAREFGVKSRIVYGGDIARSENKAMVDLLNIEIFPFQEGEEKDYDLFAIVDSQKNSGNNAIPDEVIPDITFDHHDIKVPRHKFHEIVPEIGATSTIVLQYFLHYGLQVNRLLATSYCYALFSETKDLDRSATSKDLRFYNRIYPFADLKVLSRIRHAKKPLTFFDTLKTALNSYKINENVISCILGEVESIDYIPEIADMLVEIKEIDFSLVVGSFNGKNIISARSSIEDASMGRILMKVIGKKGNAGGHDMIAAGQFSCSPRTIIRELVEKLSKIKRPAG